MNKISSIFRAFKYRNFRLFFPGLAICQIGIWIQNIAISWLVYDITKSPLTMGTVMFFNAIPLFILTPFMGVIVDKFNRHKLLLLVQILFAIQALLITLVTISGNIQLRDIILCGVFLNCIASLDAPLRQSTFVLLVDDKKDLQNAITLNASMFNIARFIGPAIGGLLIAYTNITFCFFMNFLCILPNIFLVKMMKIDDCKSEEIKNENIFDGLKIGIKYVFENPQILLLQVYLAIFCLLMLAYPMLMPIYTVEVLKSNAHILGYILGSVGVGSLLTSLILSAKTTVYGMKRILYLSCLAICFAYVVLGLIHNVYLTMLIMFVAGIGLTGVTSPQNILLQNIVDEEKRGRVMSINSLCYMGTISVSSYLCGALAHCCGIKNTFIILGIAMFIIGSILSFVLSKFDYFKKI